MQFFIILSQALSVDLFGRVSADADSVVAHYGQTKLHTPESLFMWQIDLLNNPHLGPFP